MNQRAVLGAGTAVLVSLLLAFSGCSAAGSEGEPSVDPVSSAPTTEKVAPNTMAEGKGRDAADGEFPRTVVHFAGETEIPAQPQRVVVIATGQLDVSVTLGVARSAPPRVTGPRRSRRTCRRASPSWPRSVRSVSAPNRTSRRSGRSSLTRS